MRGKNAPLVGSSFVCDKSLQPFTQRFQRDGNAADGRAHLSEFWMPIRLGDNMPRVSKLSCFLLVSPLVAAVTMFSAGCGSGGSSTSARIRFVNASTNQLSVNVLIDSVSVTSALANVGGSTGYLAVKSGARRIQIQDPTDLVFLIDTTPTIPSGDTTYIIRDRNVAGVLPPPMILSDINTAPTTGNFSVRAINLAPDLNAGTDGFIVASTVATLVGVTPTFAALPYPPTTATYVAIAAGTGNWQAVFTPPGVPTTFDATPLAISLVAGQIETVLLVEDAGGNKTVVPLVDVQ